MKINDQGERIDRLTTTYQKRIGATAPTTVFDLPVRSSCCSSVRSSCVLPSVPPARAQERGAHPTLCLPHCSPTAPTTHTQSSTLGFATYYKGTTKLLKSQVFFVFLFVPFVNFFARKFGGPGKGSYPRAKTQ